MIVKADELGPIIRGELDEITVTRRPPKMGRIVEVSTRDRATMCTVKILDWWIHNEGGYVVRFRLEQPEPIRLLAKRSQHGYTDRPSEAMFAEGEAVPAEYQNLLSMQAHSRWAEHQQTERAEQQAREDARRIGATIRDILLTMARTGSDSAPFVADLQRLAARQRQDRAA